MMIDGSHLRDLIREAISNNGDSFDSSPQDDGNMIEMMDDDEAEEARKYFGVF